MELPEDIQNLHHAYCLISQETRTARDLITQLQSKYEMAFRGNPDFIFIETDTVTIDIGRELKAFQSKKAFGPRKLIVISARSMTVDAQNSLLKTFEEPAAHTHFFLILPRLSMLPTLRSRFSVIREIKNTTSTRNIRQFMGENRSGRLRIIKQILDRENKKEVEVFLEDLEKYLHNTHTSAKKMSDVLKMKKYAFARSASLKQILEHLALVL